MFSSSIRGRPENVLVTSRPGDVNLPRKSLGRPLDVRLGRPVDVISRRPQDVQLGRPRGVSSGRPRDCQIGPLGDVLGTLDGDVLGMSSGRPGDQHLPARSILYKSDFKLAKSTF